MVNWSPVGFGKSYCNQAEFHRPPHPWSSLSPNISLQHPQACSLSQLVSSSLQYPSILQLLLPVTLGELLGLCNALLSTCACWCPFPWKSCCELSFGRSGFLGRVKLKPVIGHPKSALERSNTSFFESSRSIERRAASDPPLLILCWMMLDSKLLLSAKPGPGYLCVAWAPQPHLQQDPQDKSSGPQWNHQLAPGPGARPCTHKKKSSRKEVWDNASVKETG